jgi:hypothetical protein
MKKIIFATLFIAGLLVGYITARLTPDFLKKTPTGIPQLVGHIVLSKEYSNGSLRDTGVSIPYDITGTYPETSIILLSHDKSKVLSTVWENAHIVIYVSNVDGSGVKKIAEQNVAEGSGGLDTSSIRWSDDDTYITYVESGFVCNKPTCVNPDDFSTGQTAYRVDVNSGNKTTVSASNTNNQTAAVSNPVDGSAFKTYTSKKFGFSFEYPNGYYVTELGNEVGLSGGPSEMWDYNISAEQTKFKTINDWLTAQPKGGETSSGIGQVLRIDDDTLLVNVFEIVDYNGNKPIYGKHLDAVTVKDGKIFTVAIRSQQQPQAVPWITKEALAIIASIR